MIRTLFAAACGGAIGIALLIVMGTSFREHSLWPVLILGLLCGMSMRWVARQEGNSYLKGGLAAAVVLLAVMGGKFALAALLTNAMPANKAYAATVEENPTGVADPQRADSFGGPLEPPTDAFARSLPRGQLGPSARGEYSFYDGIWLVLGALIAYQLGKGKQDGRSRARAITDA